MSSCDFPVGSIVYFLHNKTERVLPALVYEKIVRTSMDGEKSTYIVKVRSKPKPPSKEGFTLLEVDPAVVDIFQTPEEMKTFMVARATDAVDILVDTAVKAADVFEVQDLAIKEPSKIDATPNVSDDYKNDHESWHIPQREPAAAGEPIKTSNKEASYAEVDLGDGRKARLKI